MKPAWHQAVKRGDVRTVRTLLAAGTDPDARDRYGQTGLMLAAYAGHGKVVEALLAAGARLDVVAKFGMSALMMAIVGGQVEVARRLAQAGADRTIRGTGAPGFARKTAADLARERGMTALAEEIAPPVVDEPG
ncbi:MAG: ankyrin repeat domain-containing protein [Candidatus Eisenbacteria bacterium]